MLLAQGAKRELILARIDRIEKEYAEQPSIELTNDLAVARILIGRYDEAITLLRDLDARHPGRAATGRIPLHDDAQVWLSAQGTRGGKAGGVATPGRGARRGHETLTISRFGPVAIGAAPRMVRSSSLVSLAGMGLLKK